MWMIWSWIFIAETKNWEGWMYMHEASHGQAPWWTSMKQTTGYDVCISGKPNGIYDHGWLSMK